ncbi:alveolar macrophage chemotactic factor-like [Engraulis encrasicolus]|uniref:alveolar macrophage chemotactic factor-like n=1 Tax=Engraulis encrasicolus TaxID=184585 RepID=UPI002FD469E8
MDTRILLLLSLTVYLALAQKHPTQRCTCRRIRNKLEKPKQIQDIQILPPSPSCDKLEIVVTIKNGFQYCMDPNSEKLQNIIRAFLEMKNKSAAQLTTISPSDV